MKALILDNRVVDVCEDGKEFPVAADMKWMDGAPEGCCIGWTVEDGVITAPPPPPEKTYQQKRSKAYPSYGDQLDDLYHAGVISADMAAKLKKVKDDIPKS